MRKLPLAAFFLTLVACAAFAEDSKYSVRDAGFVEFEARPYRLVLLSKNPAAPDVKKQQADLYQAMRETNIVLVHFPSDPKNISPAMKKIKIPDKLPTPVFWLVAPDDRVIPFDPAKSMGDLVHSNVRQAIHDAVTESLCTVLLVESTDARANEIAKAKIVKALESINRNLAELKAPMAEVKCLTLTVGQREKERWTLWGLGEDVTVATMPKVAVIFGKMRRAGPLFEGSEWNVTDLVRRIAGLAEPCDSSLDRKQFTDPMLPFRWARDWPEKLLPFNPVSDAVQVEVKEILQKPPLSAEEQETRKQTFEAMISGFKERGDIEPPDENHGFKAPAAKEPVVAGPSIFASTEVAVGFLVIGITGWIALGLVALILLRPRESRAESPESKAIESPAGSK